LAATPILYHSTSNQRIVSILQKDRFELKPAEGTNSETDTSKGAYYLSTTTSKVGKYTTAYKGWGVIVLDGTKLNQKYKILPVDYWQATHEMFKTPMNDEAEERVLSKSSFISKAASYIKEVHAVISVDRPEETFSLKKLCLLKHLPVYFYDDVKAFKLQNKSKAIKPPITVLEKKKEEPWDADYTSQEKLDKWKRNFRRNDLSSWIELYYKKVPENTGQFYITQGLKERAKDLFSKLGEVRRGIEGSEVVRMLDTQMHNSKSVDYENMSKAREELDKLVSILRKNKWTTKQFVQFLYDKWYARDKK
jgi:hypothetical protein